MSKIKKSRLDQLLVERGLAETRTRAQALVMAGLVMSGTRRLDKPGHRIDLDIPLTVKGPDHPWVSRGGVKLAHGLDHFALWAEGLDDQLAELDGRKIKYDKRLAWNDTMVQVFFEDPNGVIIELGYDAAKEGVTKENYESVPA